MKVIQIMDNFCEGGGVNSFVYDLCHALQKEGCEVILIGLLKEGYKGNQEVKKLKDDGIRVICLGAESKKEALLRYIPTLRKLIKEIASEGTTICNLHLKLGVLMGILASLGIKNVRCIETYHNTYHHYHLQCWFCSPFIKRYICVSDTAKEEMHRRFFIPYKKIISIPNGVSREDIRRLAQISEYNPDNNKLNIVSVGRLSYEKNFSVPIEALLNLCNKNVTYTIVGGGDQEQELRELAKANNYIHLLGAQTREESLKELAKADIVIMPSLWEGRSILQLEAMALDKPMIISDVPGLREPFDEPALKKDEIFRICKFGYLVRTNNLRSYQMSIEHFIKNGYRNIHKYVKKISEKNDMTFVARKYIREYREIYES